MGEDVNFQNAMFPKFHSTLKKSEIRAVKGNEITIYQVFKTYLFGFPINFKNLFLVNEKPNRFTLEISQIEGEFKKYHSIWKIEKKNITLLKINTSITLSNLEKIFISKKMLITQYKKFVGDLKKQLKHQKYEKMCSN